MKKLTKDTFKIEWKEYLTTQKLSDRTINEYTRYLDSYFNKNNEVNKEQMDAWIRKNNNNVARAFIKKLIEFLVDHDYMDEKLLLYRIPKIRGRKKKKEIIILSRGEVEYMAESTNNKRLKLMILVTYYCGLRLSELINIRFKDINWNKQQIKVLGKNKKIRYVPICNRLLKEMVDYIDSKPIEAVKDAYKNNVKFFPRSKIWFSKQLTKVSKKSLQRAINPHLLRHSVSSYLRRRGLDLQKVQEFLGHENIDTTIRYSHLDKSETKKDIIKVFES